jgi:flagellar motor switch protein FliM
MLENQDTDEHKPDDEVEWDNDLNQDEINNILGFDLSSEEGEDRSGLRALINSAFVAHRRMPMLDAVFDRAARQMTTSLRHMTNDNVEVDLDDVSALRFGEFIQSVPTPSVIGVLRAEALSNYCLIAVDATLVFSIVDLLLGGKRGGSVLSFEERGFTQIELGLIEKVMSLLADDLTDAFKPVSDIDFVLDRLETTPRFAAIAQDASVCTLAKFRIDMEDRGGRAAALFPHATLEPIQKILRREFVSETGIGEQTWRDQLTAGVSAASVDLRAVIAEKDISIAALSRLTCGDTISFGGAGDIAEIRAGALTLARGRVGKSGDAIALRLAPEEMSADSLSTARTAKEQAA